MNAPDIGNESCMFGWGLMWLLLLQVTTVAAVGKCNFEVDKCGWTNSKPDDFDWVVRSGETESSCTGPDNDHTKGNINGKYIYIETSSPRQPGDTAVLLSATFQPSGRMCMKFYYHMFGDTIGTLSVLVKPQNENPTLLWSLSGHQGCEWMEGVVAVEDQTSAYQILIQGICGSSYTGDIAIDDITFTQQCGGSLTPQKATVAVAVPDKWTPIHTASVIVGVMATVIMAVLVAVIIYLCRTVSALKTTDGKRMSTKTDVTHAASHDPCDPCDTDSEECYENIRPAGTAKSYTAAQKTTHGKRTRTKTSNASYGQNGDEEMYDIPTYPQEPQDTQDSESYYEQI